jgi:hypothetical protein
MNLKITLMTEKQVNTLREELTNPPKYNIQPIEIDVEQKINNTPDSKWLTEFKAICFQYQYFKDNQRKWWQFWKH